MSIPVRVYAPKSIADHQTSGKRMPLVIALHGAGGDENMFFEAYGAGRIKQLADAHDFIVVSPSTYFMIPNPQALSSIVQAMSDAYPIDPTRIYILGHSMGAMTAQGLLARQPRILAACALIAGGNAFANTPNIPPTLVYAGEIDPMFPMQRMVRIWQDATAAGLPVDLQVAKGFGHTLVVGEVLPEVIAWLLKHRYEAPTTQPGLSNDAGDNRTREVSGSPSSPSTAPSN
jgi:predicted esterase